MISIGVGIDYGVGFIGNDVNFYFSIEYYIFNMDILGIINVLNIYFDGDNSIDFSISGIIFLVVIGVGESILFMVIFVFVLVLFGLEDFIFVDMDWVVELYVVSNDLDESDYVFFIGGMVVGEVIV